MQVTMKAEASSAADRLAMCGYLLTEFRDTGEVEHILVPAAREDGALSAPMIKWDSPDTGCRLAPA